MTRKALARTYRPTHFADLIAQEHVAAGLRGAVAKDRVAHGYLLTGPRGTGKTTAARILAMALNCEDRGSAPGPGEPCGVCDSCRRIWAGSTNLDVVEIDAASNRGVDDARDLRERAMYAASAPDRFKVYIVDEAHMLTREAWNALLKILEEPPPGVVFVFATTEPQKIANTTTAVLSRLQRFDFRNIGPRAIEARLRDVAGREAIDIEDDALVLISRVANGGMRDALSLLDQVVVFEDGRITADSVRSALGLISDELYVELLEIVAEGRAGDVFGFVERIVEQGADLGEFVNGAGEVLRALAVLRLDGEPQGITDGLRSGLDALRDTFSEGDVLRMLSMLGSAEESIRKSANTRLQVETLLLRWALMDRTVDIEAVLAAMSGGAAPPAPSAPGRPRPRSGEGKGTGKRRRPRPEPTDAPTDAAAVPARPQPDGSADPVAGSAAAGSGAEAWEQIAQEVRESSPLLGAALAHAVPQDMTDGEIRVRVTDPETNLEPLRRRQAAFSEAASSVYGQSVRVVFETSETEREERSAPRRRSTIEENREAKLQSYRAQDPTLDAMADALDLELSE